MTADVELDWQLGLAPEVRMALFGYQQDFGTLPAVIWRVPGTVTLLSGGQMPENQLPRGPRPGGLLPGGPQLTVAAPWGAIAAGGPGPDGVRELIRMEQPGVRERLTAAPTTGPGPSWAAGEAVAGEAGARLVVRSELPDGAGAGASAAGTRAVGLCLGDPAALGPDLGLPSGLALLGGDPVPCDLAAAGLRLMIVDPRVRRAPRAVTAEDSPVAAAAAVVARGDFAALGALLTAAHEAQPCDPEQQAAVTAALRAGALGARAISDGPGRPVCVLVAVDRVAAVRAAVSAELTRDGGRAPRCLTFTPAPGPDQPALL
jgi:galactokinase